ncbi:MAG: PTS transporter subunit EIIB [Tenericutes bacterium]|nr:PTS transporter subunit EIIB [Mycoplasmatota bacterium]MDD6387728.1 PTS transporter subunit EIIB [Bacilli bacterium]MDY3800565.1 PTS transporter subunit EIIB [Bacilli bacterium]
MEFVQYIIIIVLAILIALAVSKAISKDAKIEVNKLVEYLGGKDNIVNYEVNKSRFVVTLKDITKVNKESIQKMGAQGMVEIDNQLKIILGNDAQALKKQIDALK